MNNNEKTTGEKVNESDCVSEQENERFLLYHAESDCYMEVFGEAARVAMMNCNGAEEVLDVTGIQQHEEAVLKMSKPEEQNKGVPPVDLSAPGVKKAIAQRVKADIDKVCEVMYDDGHRTHLGASKIGEDCARALWYGFRWVSIEKFNGRMLRLFQRGHREEPFVFEHLRRAGFEIFEHDHSLPLKHGKPQQYRFSSVCGHFGGSVDAVCKLPAHYNIVEPMLVSVKTHNTGSAFSDLGTDGVKVVKPVHYAQECVYGRAFGLKYAVYVYRNKNDDDQHIEIVELDHKHGEQLEMKAERIIFSKEPPPRISENPAFKTCKGCHFGNDKSGICFKKPGHTPIDRNCRSCKHAEPSENKTWLCQFENRSAHMGPIPAEVIKTGCPNYDAIV